MRTQRWSSGRRLLEVPGAGAGGGAASTHQLSGGDSQRQQPAPPEWDELQDHTAGAPCHSGAHPAPEASEPLGGDQGGIRASQGRKGRRRRCASLARLQIGWYQGPLLGFEAAARLGPRAGWGGVGRGGAGRVPRVADACQAAAVHLQNAVSQRQPPISCGGAAREQGLDVESRGAQGRVLRETGSLRAPRALSHGAPAQAPPHLPRRAGDTHTPTLWSQVCLQGRAGHHCGQGPGQTPEEEGAGGRPCPSPHPWPSSPRRCPGPGPHGRGPPPPS